MDQCTPVKTFISLSTHSHTQPLNNICLSCPLTLSATHSSIFIYPSTDSQPIFRLSSHLPIHPPTHTHNQSSTHTNLLYHIHPTSQPANHPLMPTHHSHPLVHPSSHQLTATLCTTSFHSVSQLLIHPPTSISSSIQLPIQPHPSFCSIHQVTPTYHPHSPPNHPIPPNCSTALIHLSTHSTCIH